MYQKLLTNLSSSVKIAVSDVTKVRINTEGDKNHVYLRILQDFKKNSEH